MAAQNEARAAGNAEIAPEHLVLGLLAEPDGLAAKAIAAQGVTAGRGARGRGRAPCPPRPTRSPELVPYDAAARKALELTFREALRLGPQLHRHRAHPAGPAGARGRRRRAHRPRHDKPAVEADLATALAAVVKAASKGDDAQ